MNYYTAIEFPSSIRVCKIRYDNINFPGFYKKVFLEEMWSNYNLPDGKFKHKKR